MKTILILLTALSTAYGFDEQEKETIRKTFPAATRLDVDNVHGSIHVTGYNGSDIQMTAEKTIHAESRERLEAARREVKLDTEQSGDRLSLYVDGPFRCNCDDRRSVHERRWQDYRVTFDFDLKVPVGTSIRLATVNGGSIDVKNVTGDFDVSNVNGGVELNEMGGSGEVHTVNGKIAVTFTKNPTKSCSFRTVNGSVDVSFRPNLSADVQVKTFNGNAYTDFDATAMPVSAAVSERRDGKFVYRSNRFSAFRVGNGGPELKFDTLNGSIRIINRGQ